MKKVSDLYCVRHDSESCGCREQLALPNVNYTKFEFTETPHAHVEWRREVLGQRVEPSMKPARAGLGPHRRSVHEREAIRVAAGVLPPWLFEAVHNFAMTMYKNTGLRSDGYAMPLEIVIPNDVGARFGFPAEGIIVSTGAGFVKLVCR